MTFDSEGDVPRLRSRKGRETRIRPTERHDAKNELDRGWVAPASDEEVDIMRRDTMQIVGKVGDKGRQPGQFYAVHSLALDSKGNLYTAETQEGKRLQKFVYRGMAPAPSTGRN